VPLVGLHMGFVRDFVFHGQENMSVTGELSAVRRWADSRKPAEAGFLFRVVRLPPLFAVAGHAFA
jgi:hypothetical protein